MAWTLAHLLERELDAASVARGRALAGAVRIVGRTPFSVSAKVQGSAHQPYDLTVAHHGEQVVAECSCPQFERADGCKHLYALCLVIDRGRLLELASDEVRYFSTRQATDAGLFNDDIEDFEDWDDDSETEVEAEFRSALRTVEGKEQHAGFHSLLRTVRQQSETRSKALDGELVYALDDQVAGVLFHPRDRPFLPLRVFRRYRTKKGEVRLQRQSLQSRGIESISTTADREIATILCGPRHAGHSHDTQSDHLLDTTAARLVCERLSGTDRLLRRKPSKAWAAKNKWLSPDDFLPLRWEPDQAASYAISFEEGDDGYLVRMLVTRGALTLTDHTIYRGAWELREESDAVVLCPTEGTDSPWVQWFLASGQRHIRVPVTAEGPLAQALVESERAAPENVAGLRVPQTLRYEATEIDPVPVFRLEPRPESTKKKGGASGTFVVRYSTVDLDPNVSGDDVFDAVTRTRYRRNRGKEGRWLRWIHERAPSRVFSQARQCWMFVFADEQLDRFALDAIIDGWVIEGLGRSFRKGDTFRLQVKSSGIDWFELAGEANFSGELVPIADLLAAQKRKEKWVRLGDGSIGLLPSEWLLELDRWASLLDKDRRIPSSSIAILEAMASERLGAVELDDVALALREKFSQAKNPVPREPPAAFRGVLRHYQKEGIGWLAWLEESGFGGCLADDMGLGKTVQVLAHLAEVYGHNREMRKASLLIVPRSVVGQWFREAARFVPSLRMAEHASGKLSLGSPGDADVFITTYGMVVRDIESLSRADFEYVILDEAHAIKNRVTATARACKLLRGRHRLALTGTPVENHPGELVSLMGFLNPTLVEAPFFRRVVEARGMLDSDSRKILATAVAPFLLRRTKAQVAMDLPPRSEEVLYCALSDKERVLYQSAREHYRQKLLSPAALKGLPQSKMNVLEALLRLRQLACHPSLISAKNQDATFTVKRSTKRSQRTVMRDIEDSGKSRPALSAKLELLLEKLRSAAQTGEKSLVFSQFTSFLSLVAQALEAQGIGYAYLDGQSRDRDAIVDQFRNDPKAGVFLISLKAGGVGLHLPEASYVFLLDPWWNPAVENQAIDRAHRIGQTKPVFAYRLIAKDTVEERVLELQEKKRALVEDLMTGSGTVLKQMSAEDLDALLT